MATKWLLCLLLSLSTFTTSPATTTFSSASIRFIHASCNFTLYPDLCFSSLSPYASVVHQDPVLLSLAATNVSRAHARAVLTHVTALHSSSKRVTAALRDCRGMLGDAVERTRAAAAELEALKWAVGDQVAWRVANAQTWMSAALTNEETCTDGFQGVAGGVRDDVCSGVGRLKEFTSNALALVNHLVSSPLIRFSSSSSEW